MILHARAQSARKSARHLFRSWPKEFTSVVEDREMFCKQHMPCEISVEVMQFGKKLGSLWWAHNESL